MLLALCQASLASTRVGARPARSSGVSSRPSASACAVADGGGVIERAKGVREPRARSPRRLPPCAARGQGQARGASEDRLAKPGAEPTTPVDAQGCLRNPDEGRERATHGRPLGRALAVVEDPPQHVGGAWPRRLRQGCECRRDLHCSAQAGGLHDVDLEPWSGTGSSGTVAEGSAAGLSLGSSDMIGRGASRWCPFSRPPGRP